MCSITIEWKYSEYNSDSLVNLDLESSNSKTEAAYLMIIPPDCESLNNNLQTTHKTIYFRIL